MEQDFRLLLGEVTANRFLEKWPTSLKAKAIKEIHGPIPTTDLLALLQKAELASEVENAATSATTSCTRMKAVWISSGGSSHQIPKGWSWCTTASRQYFATYFLLGVPSEAAFMCSCDQQLHYSMYGNMFRRSS
ncbi:hypothetical protein CHARACLAT_026962 [Characodon lateralis]|uniref:Uncharacterized protein n=1 Tax=Characodon lateralis TaxID=208331 RepID=A0ABU7DE21_9TELE|nr:hypothetical protein [Characodon lateralis]